MKKHLNYCLVLNLTLVVICGIPACSKNSSDEDNGTRDTGPKIATLEEIDTLFASLMLSENGEPTTFGKFQNIRETGKHIKNSCSYVGSTPEVVFDHFLACCKEIVALNPDPQMTIEYHQKTDSIGTEFVTEQLGEYESTFSDKTTETEPKSLTPFHGDLEWLVYRYLSVGVDEKSIRAFRVNVAKFVAEHHEQFADVEKRLPADTSPDISDPQQEKSDSVLDDDHFPKDSTKPIWIKQIKIKQEGEEVVFQFDLDQPVGREIQESYLRVVYVQESSPIQFPTCAALPEELAWFFVLRRIDSEFEETQLAGLGNPDDNNIGIGFVIQVWDVPPKVTRIGFNPGTDFQSDADKLVRGRGKVLAGFLDRDSHLISNSVAIGFDFGSFNVIDLAEMDLAPEQDLSAEATAEPDRDQEVTEDPFRLWSSADSQFQIEAMLVDVEADVVRLKRQDTGKVISVNIEDLSTADREFIEKNRK